MKKYEEQAREKEREEFDLKLVLEVSKIVFLKKWLTISIITLSRLIYTLNNQNKWVGLD